MTGRALFYGLTICVLVILLALSTKKYQYGWQISREHTFQTEEGGGGVGGLITSPQDEGPPHIYLMAVRYSGQQGAGITAIASLQCWGGRSGLNATVVEPSIRNTTIIGFFKKDMVTVAMTLGDYFDMKHLNAASRKVGNAEVISQEEFFAKPLKKVVVIRTMNKNNYKVLWSSDDPASPCYKGKKFLYPPMPKLKRRGYCLVRVMDVGWPRLKRENLKHILGKYYNQSITLVFTKWDGPWFVYERNIPSHCEGRKAKSWFLPSKRLLKDAKRYEDTYLRSMNSLSIMIRLEHVLLLAQKNRKRTVSYCLQQVKGLNKKLQRGKSKRIPMVTADIGFYGSNSFGWAIKDKLKLDAATAQVKNMIPALLDHRLNFDRWEKSFVKTANGVTNQGYIAALQRVIASRADCLVLVGGGVFQELALRDYLRLHTSKAKRCVYFVCAENEYVLNRVIQLADKGQLS